MPIGKGRRISREAAQPWLPFVFSAFLSSMAIVGPLVALMNTPMSSDWWLPAFAGFLPMCFFFAGSAMSQMRKEIAALRLRVAALEAGDSAAPLVADDNSTPPQFSLKLLFAAVAVLAVQFALIAKLLDKVDGVLKAPPLVVPRAPAPPAKRIRPLPRAPAPPASSPSLRPEA